MNTLQDLYIEELRDIYDAENQIVKARPDMIKAANTEELKQGFQEHLEQTKEQIARLDKIFTNAGVSPKGHKCVGMAGIISECQDLIEEEAESTVLDSGLIACAQKVEHYEIASYGSACSFARVLGNDEDEDALQDTLDEEKETDEKLTDLSSTINSEAAELGVEEEKPASKE